MYLNAETKQLNKRKDLQEQKYIKRAKFFFYKREESKQKGEKRTKHELETYLKKKKKELRSSSSFGHLYSHSPYQNKIAVSRRGTKLN
jgi:hypothetical protein